MALIPVELRSSGDWSTIFVYQSTNVRWLINNHITWVTWLWLQVSGFKPGLPGIGRCLFKVLACVVLGGPIQSAPSLGFTGLVSAIPCASLTLGGPLRTEVQVCDSMCKYQDWWDQEGLNGCNGPCAKVFDFFVPINSNRSTFLLMIFNLQWLLYLNLFWGDGRARGKYWLKQFFKVQKCVGGIVVSKLFADQWRWTRSWSWSKTQMDIEQLVISGCAVFLAQWAWF